MNVYDFDNTIYDGESSVDFFLYCLDKNRSLIIYLPLILYTAVLYKMKILSMEKLYKTAEKLTSLFINNKEDISIMVDDFWSLNSKKLKMYYINKLSEKDVVITASPSFLINGILDRLKTNNVICSEFNTKTGKFEFVCYKENKVKAFKEKYPNTDIDNFYTDSLNDISFIKIAKKSFLVRKNKQLKLIERKDIL